MKYIFHTVFLLLFTGLVTFAQPGQPDQPAPKPVYTPSTRMIAHPIGNRTIIIKVLQYGEPNGIYCINMHDNEETAVLGAIPVLEQTGGTLIRVENFKQRVIRFRLKGIVYGFDPNRIFSKTGIEQTMRDNKRINKTALLEIEKFGQRLLSLIPDTASIVVALHNNTNDLFSIKSYTAGGVRQKDARAVYYNETQDVDDITLTTDSLVYQVMADAGYNAIWQDNARAKKDGSLSIYCGDYGRRYINIETEHGKVDQYREMFEKLVGFLYKEKEAVAQSAENPAGKKESTDQ